MRIKFNTLLLLCLLLFGRVFSQSVNTAKLDSLFNSLEQNNKAMGSVAISKNGKIVYSKAIGYSLINGNNKVIANTNSKYRIGSISKMFTATIIFQLIEENKIALNTPISNYFPTLPNATKITISHLLNHRSGLHNFTDDPDYSKWMTKAHTQKEMLAIITKGKSDFEPDSKASYSNSNFVVLGYIIEKVCNKKYTDVLKERITSKVNLSDTYYGGKTSHANNECFSFQYVTNWKQVPETDMTDMSIPHGAGAIVSTPTDLTTFLYALFKNKLVSQSSLDKMKTLTDGYGMGMFQFPFYTKKGFGHTGGIDGFSSVAAYFPDDSTSVAYCTNGVVYPMNDILIAVLSIYYNKPYQIPSFNNIVLSGEELNKYIGTYSSTEAPIKITISKDKNSLIAQASGQSSFPLEPYGTARFKFERVGIIIEFNLTKNELLLKQSGSQIVFTKDK